MLSVQAKTTLVAYGILMLSFLVPLEGDKSLSKKLALMVVMLIPIGLAVYTVNCLVTGSKGKLGLGCNVLAWLNSISILLTCVLILLSNMSSKKVVVEENFAENPGTGDNDLGTLILGGAPNAPEGEHVSLAGAGAAVYANTRQSPSPNGNFVYNPVDLFNKENTGWSSNINDPNVLPAYILIRFNDEKKVSNIRLWPYPSTNSISGYTPRTIKIYGSNHDNWVVNDDDGILTITSDSDKGQKIFEEINNEKETDEETGEETANYIIPSFNDIYNGDSIRYEIDNDKRGLYKDYLIEIENNYFPDNHSEGFEKNISIKELALYEENVDCILGTGGEIGSCVPTVGECGSGTQTRTRTGDTPATGEGSACPSTTETLPCEVDCPQPVDCTVGSWAEWGSCTLPEGSSCGSGVETRTREITGSAQNSGSCPEPLEETQYCNVECNTDTGTGTGGDNDGGDNDGGDNDGGDNDGGDNGDDGDEVVDGTGGDNGDDSDEVIDGGGDNDGGDNDGGDNGDDGDDGVQYNVQDIIDTVASIQGTSASALTGSLRYNVQLVGDDSVQFCFKSPNLEGSSCHTFRTNN